MKNKPILLGILFLLTSLSCFYFITTFEKSSSPPEKPLILVSLPPYKQLVEEIVGNECTVMTVVPVGVDPHLYESKPSDLQRMQYADVWFGVGEFFEPRLKEVLSSHHSSFTYVHLGEVLRENHPSLLIYTSKEKKSYNNHFWLSPSLDKIQSEIILETLSNLYPKMAKNFEKNQHQLKKKLDLLSLWIETQFSDLRPIRFLTPHPAYAYFAKEFNVEEVTFEHEGKEPTIGQMGLFLEEHENQSFDAVLIDPYHDPRGGEFLAKAKNIPLFRMNPYAVDYVKTIEELSLELAFAKKNHEQK